MTQFNRKDEQKCFGIMIDLDGIFQVIDQLPQARKIPTDYNTTYALQPFYFIQVLKCYI